MIDPVEAKRRTNAPTTLEKKYGLVRHQEGGGFSMGPRVRGAPTYDHRRNNRANAHLPPRHYWIPGGTAAVTHIVRETKPTGPRTIRYPFGEE